MTVIGIVAIAKNYAIGKDGKLPWHYSSDMKFFRRTTTGSAVVMGFHTWKSIGKPLSKRLNIVLSRKSEFESQPNLLKLSSREEVIALSQYLAGDLFIIGGGKTWAGFAYEIEKWIVTRIPVEVADADTFMPIDFLNGFESEKRVEIGDGLEVEFFEKR